MKENWCDLTSDKFQIVCFLLDYCMQNFKQLEVNVIKLWALSYNANKFVIVSRLKLFDRFFKFPVFFK
jgi:hypothetical protein